MEIDRVTSLLDPVRYVPSSHCDDRPENMTIDMIVIHNISLPPDEFDTGAIEKFFTGTLDFSQNPYFKTIAELKVSSHLLIDRGGIITQFVPFAKRAWHAGQSSFEGRDRCNDFSIGIELEGTDNKPYEKVQYLQLANAINVIRKYYPAILRKRIVGHSDISPGRKTDPGPAFIWDFLDCLLDP